MNTLNLTLPDREDQGELDRKGAQGREDLLGLGDPMASLASEVNQARR